MFLLSVHVVMVTTMVKAPPPCHMTRPITPTLVLVGGIQLVRPHLVTPVLLTSLASKARLVVDQLGHQVR